ncbi:MAG TPA: septal ring lytic transglycosylase RlpA family protein [Myxococcaceae bacterium]|nr:septal ring lytic transglycosylase RlpA family protein [Myxococcaceae bacterium]
MTARVRSRWLWLFSALVLGGCARSARPDADREVQERRPPSAGGKGSLGEGWASYYGPGFHGKLTANGERFNRHAYTAAHRTLPFNACVRVQSVDTGKQVRLRVNDRGPYAKKRVIDVSEAAARELGMMKTGVMKVRLFRC